MEITFCPRSFAKTAADAAITLLAAGCITALALGRNPFQDQAANTTAETIEAHAQMEQAQAQLSQASALNEKAQAALMDATELAQLSAKLLMTTADTLASSAFPEAGAAVEATPEGHFGGYGIIGHKDRPFANPAMHYAQYTQRADFLKFEIDNKVDCAAIKPLTEEGLATKQEELKLLQRKIASIQTDLQQDIAALVKAFAPMMKLAPPISEARKESIR